SGGLRVFNRAFGVDGIEEAAAALPGYIQETSPDIMVFTLLPQRPFSCALRDRPAPVTALPQDYAPVISSAPDYDAKACVGQGASDNRISVRESALLASAEAMSLRSKHGEAAASLEKGLSEFPSSTALRTRLIRELVLQRSFYAALAQLAEGRRAAPGGIEEFYGAFFGTVNVMGGTKKTKKFAEEELSVSPRSAALHEALSQAWLPAGGGDRFNADDARDARMALYYAMKGLSFNPCAAGLRLAAANAYYALGLNEEAHGMAVAALSLSPGLAQARALLALLCARKGDYAGAETQISALSGQEPVLALRLSGEILVSRGRFSEAAETYVRAFESGPDSDMAMRAARAFFATKDYDESSDWYKKAVRLNPDDPEAHFGLGNAAMKLGLRTDALKAYASAAKAVPVSRDSYRDMARVLSWLEPDYALEAGRLIPGFRDSAYFKAMRSCTESQSPGEAGRERAFAFESVLALAGARHVRVLALALPDAGNAALSALASEHGAEFADLSGIYSRFGVDGMNYYSEAELTPDAKAEIAARVAAFAAGAGAK
ncbi:MAG: tetratricopeptide repeat protein, partial [Elusimicrobia bacterium]|nr:tetratricopeptide repeat protein [Elusimicrobiota bacterium]